MIRTTCLFAVILSLFAACYSPLEDKSTTSSSGSSTTSNTTSSNTSSSVVVPTTAPSVATGTGTIDLQSSSLRQTIEGFGGATAWTSSLPSTAVIQALFDPSQGIGLTLIRNRIPFREDTSQNDNFVGKTAGAYTRDTATYTGHSKFTLNWSNWDLANTKNLYAKASVYSSQIQGFSTPWTPANNSVDQWKINDPNGKEGSVTNTVGGTLGTISDYPSIGGILDPNHYADYADLLADYVQGFESNMGYPLAAVSLQNEPNYLPQNYESCWWSAPQIQSFLPSIQSAWTAKNVNTPVMTPESFTFSEGLVTGVLGNSSLASSVPIVAVHQYNTTGLSNPAANYAQAQSLFGASWLTTTKSAGKRLWETEVSTQASADDTSIAGTLYWARLVHADLTLAEVNAFCGWWLWYASPAALVDTSTAAPVYTSAYYAVGAFSKFVRPGWRRLGVDTNPVSGVETSAYKDPNSKAYAVILINSSSSTQSVTISGNVSTAESYRTSATEKLLDVGALTPASGTITVTLPALSLTTVSGLTS